MEAEGSDVNIKSLKSNDKVINTVLRETILKTVQLDFGGIFSNSRGRRVERPVRSKRCAIAQSHHVGDKINENQVEE